MGRRRGGMGGGFPGGGGYLPKIKITRTYTVAAPP
jgi:hypothetical protein